jgi:hypothetical protein
MNYSSILSTLFLSEAIRHSNSSFWVEHMRSLVSFFLQLLFQARKKAFDEELREFRFDKIVQLESGLKKFESQLIPTSEAQRKQKPPSSREESFDHS